MPKNRRVVYRQPHFAAAAEGLTLLKAWVREKIGAHSFWFKTLTTMASNIVEVMKVSDIEQRTPNVGDIFFVLPVIVKQNPKVVKVMYVNSPELAKTLTAIPVDSCVAMTNVTVAPDFLRSTPNTKVYPNTANFHVDPDTLQEYRCPPLVSIPDIKASPYKRRISLQATVSEIGDIQTKNNVKKQRITLNDQYDRSIRMKMWGNNASTFRFKEQDTILATGLEVNVWHSQTSVNALTSSTFEVLTKKQQKGTEKEEKKKITVIASTDRSQP
ncbi:uncharacterized protein [Ptychodera flava]|uniref:uncharacterized protein isoform X2 n=1 Tax=Ptychodera flava TaxID=63121 RepID=UPI00396A4E8A